MLRVWCTSLSQLLWWCSLPPSTAFCSVYCRGLLHERCWGTHQPSKPLHSPPLLPPFLSFLASTFCSTRALLLTTNSQRWRQHRTPRPLCQCCRLRAPPRCTACAPTALLPGRQSSSPLRGSIIWKDGGGERWVSLQKGRDRLARIVMGHALLYE